MTGKADFAPEEWKLLREAPPAVGMIVLTAQGGGTFRETWALAKTYAESRKQQGESELLDALVAEKPETTRYHSPQELEEQGLARLRDAVALLEQKATPEEVEGYKRFVLNVADRVAEAHKEGSEPVSDAERAAIEKVAAALDTTPE